MQKSKPTGVVTPSPKTTPTPKATPTPTTSSSTPSSSSFVSPQSNTETFLTRKNNTPATIGDETSHAPSSDKQSHPTKPGFVPRAVLNREKRAPLKMTWNKTANDTSSKSSLVKPPSFPSLSESKESRDKLKESTTAGAADNASRMPPHVSTLPRIPKKVATVHPMPMVSPSYHGATTPQTSTQMTHRTRPAPYKTSTYQEMSRSHGKYIGILHYNYVVLVNS